MELILEKPFLVNKAEERGILPPKYVSTIPEI